MAEEALRYDDGKNRLDLIPIEWYWALGDVLTQGALKYEERNWEKGMKHGKMIGASMRHLIAYQAGEVYDKETGCHHLAMAAWNALALMSYQLKGDGENDIPVVSKEILEKVNVNKSDVPADKSNSAKRTRGNPRGGKLDSGQ